jgi:hypothetical protein
MILESRTVSEKKIEILYYSVLIFVARDQCNPLKGDVYLLYVRILYARITCYKIKK